MKDVFKFMKNLTPLEGTNSFWICKNVYNLQNVQHLANAKTEMSKWVSKRFPIAELSHGILLQMKSGIVPLFQNKKNGNLKSVHVVSAVLVLLILYLCEEQMHVPGFVYVVMGVHVCIYVCNSVN